MENFWKWLKKKLDGMPEYVKKAEAIDDTKLSDLPDNEFALVVSGTHGKTRRFPINTPANATISAEYFKDNINTLNFTEKVVAATNLKRALDKFGIKVPEVIEAYANPTIGSNVVEEEKPMPIGYLLEYGGIKSFPYSTASDISKYLAAYDEIIKEMDTNEIEIFNKNLKKAVELLNVDVPEHLIDKLAPDRIPKAVTKVAENWQKLSPTQKLKLLLAKRAQARLRFNPDKLRNAIELRKAIAYEHPIYLGKLMEAEDLFEQGKHANSIKLLAALDKFICPSADIIDEIIEPEIIGNPLVDALMSHIDELRNLFDEDTLGELFEDPEEFMSRYPGVHKVVMRIIRK